MELIRKLNVEDFANFKAVFTVFESEPFFEAWTEERIYKWIFRLFK